MNTRYILLAEDDEDLREVMRCQLEEDGMSVREADSGLDLLDLLTRGERFDLVVTDIRMPWMSGLHVATAVRRKGFDVPFIIMTAFADDELRRTVYEMKNAVFLEKPFELSLFALAVHDALAITP